jgi:exosortase A
MTLASAQVENADGSAAQRGWAFALGVLVAGMLIFGLAFRSEIAHAIQVWNASTAYNHCFLILPISAYLIWERWRALAARVPHPTFWPIAAMVPVALVWLFALSAGLMEGRQLAAMTLFQLFVFAVVGYRVWRVAAFAMLYLYFLVPAGAFITPWLQDFSARFAVVGLQVLGIPVYSDGMEIEVPGAKFTIAEACAGLRFLIASVALGTLYGYMMYRSWKRRAAFILVSIVVPIIANGFRVLGIVTLGYLLGNAQAAVADHLIYGWVFFSIVSLALILLGLPFREPAEAFPVTVEDKAVPRRPEARTLAAGALAAGLAVLLASPLIAEGPARTAMNAAIAGLKHALHS